MTMVWDMQETITRWYMKSDASSPYLATSALIEVITILFIHGNQPPIIVVGVSKGTTTFVQFTKQGKKAVSKGPQN